MKLKKSVNKNNTEFIRKKNLKDPIFDLKPCLKLKKTSKMNPIYFNESVSRPFLFKIYKLFKRIL